MFRRTHLLLAALLLLSGARTAFSFVLAGPIGNGTDGFQEPEIAYGIGADINAPKNLAEEFRWNTPVLTYAFDQNFLDYFGSNGVFAVEEAIRIWNSLTNVSSYSQTLTEFPLDTSRFNYAAYALLVFDMKSVTLHTLAEELGLGEPARWTWCLQSRQEVNPPGCPTVNYVVIKRNWDPITFEPSSYVNGTLYSYQIVEDCQQPNPLADAVELLLDPTATPLNAVADASGSFLGASAGVTAGGFWTGFTRDDVAGLRYLYRPGNVNMEAAPDNSRLLSGGFTNVDTPTILVTSNLGTLIAQSRTNAAADLQTLYPDLVIASTTNYFEIEVTTNVVAYFTNYPTSPVGTAATLVVEVNRSTNFVVRYRHTFANVITNTYYPTMWVASQTVSVTSSPTAPVGTANLVTNISPSKLKPVLTNQPSGDYYILPTNLCGYDIRLALTNLTLVTNVLISLNATNTGGVVDTNAPGTGATNVGPQSFTYTEVTYFTNHTLAAYPIECDGDTTALRSGIDRIELKRVDYDSLIGRTLIPPTNYFTHTVTTNGTSFTQRFERVTTQPDILFSASIIGADIARTAPNYTNGPAAAGGALAGPGTISGPIQITFNKLGPSYNNSGPSTILEANQTTNGVWGYYDGSTNPPIVFPNGLSISNLEYQVLHPN